MKNWLFAVAVVVASTLAVAPSVSDAKRFGGGSSSGMQRSMPNSTPAKPANAAAGRTRRRAGRRRAPRRAAAPKRSWMGPIAGLAAGLGIAALMSHLGMGESLRQLPDDGLAGGGRGVPDSVPDAPLWRQQRTPALATALRHAKLAPALAGRRR